MVNLKPSDVLHIPGLGFDGLVGYSLIARRGTICKELGTILFAGNGHTNGILRHGNRRISYQSVKSQTGNMKYTPISISPEQAQFLETRKFQINEIARSKQKSGWLHGRS